MDGRPQTRITWSTPSSFSWRFQVPESASEGGGGGREEEEEEVEGEEERAMTTARRAATMAEATDALAAVTARRPAAAEASAVDARGSGRMVAFVLRRKA
jgi:hypothetical protein